MGRLINWIMEDPKTRGAVVIALIGITGAIIGGFFSVIVWPSLKRALEILWDKIDSKLLGRNFEHRYLDWIISQHRYLPRLPTTLVNVNEATPQELDELYVALSVSQESQNKEAINLSAILKENQLLVILGDPGAGKTTMLRFLSLTFARSRRGKALSQSGDEYEREKVKVQAAKIRVSEEYRINNNPLPVFIYLNRMGDVAKWSEGRSLLDVLRDQFRSVDNLRDFPAQFFEEKLDNGECILLFDAFDELGGEEARDAIANHIGALVSAYRKNRFIVTSRIVGYQGQLTKYGFKVVTIQRLTWPLITQLINSWYDSLNATELADPLLKNIKANPRIYELAINPMLLSLIALVQYIRGLIPDRRHVLYDECVKILVERRFAPRNVQQQYNQILPGEEATRLLHDIAESMHFERIREAPREKLTSTYIPNALQTLPNSKAALLTATEILKNIEERSQLLVERGFNEEGQPVMAFSHLTFQEYLTSLAFIERLSEVGESRTSKELLEHHSKDPEWWEEVALLYAAQLTERQRDSFFACLYPER